MLNDEIKEALQYLPSGNLNYSEWLQVGMALKNEGFPCEVWEDWSASDPERYHPGECERKWNSFSRNGINGSSIFWLCKVKTGHVIHGSYQQKMKPENMAARVISEPFIQIDEPGDDWKPTEDLKRYLTLLFNPDEHVSFTGESYSDQKDGKRKPKNRTYKKTAGELVSELESAREITAVIPYDQSGGAWIGINPVDGKGGKKENITDYRFALLESDSMPIREQIEKYKLLKLPIVSVVYSGSRSAHAVVRINARNEKEYGQRVKKLFEECSKAGFEVDLNNKDPSRLSRMPGFIRGDHKQFLMTGNMGFQSYEDWEESLYIPKLPEEIPRDQMISPPPLKYPIIENYLREGEAMLLSGTSKTGKSYLICQLALAVASGGKWIGQQCMKKTVLYLDGELSPEMTAHRFKAIREKMLIPVFPETLHVINTKAVAVRLGDIASDIEHDRGKYGLIIIDPLYMFIGSDENDNSQMKNEMEMIKRICATGAAVAVVHHMSKGIQSGKLSIDRASGAGVIGRFFDSILTLNMLSAESDDSGKPERVEADTRSFRQPVPINLWFDGFHTVDSRGDLAFRQLNDPKKVNSEKKTNEDISKLNHCYHWMRENKVLNESGQFTVDDLQKAYRECYGKELSRTTACDHLKKAEYIKVSGEKIVFRNGEPCKYKVNYYIPDGSENEPRTDPASD